IVVRSASRKISRSSIESSSSAWKASIASAVETRIPLLRRMLVNSRIFFCTLDRLLRLVQHALLGSRGIGRCTRGGGRSRGPLLTFLLGEQLRELALRLPHV